MMDSAHDRQIIEHLTEIVLAHATHNGVTERSLSNTWYDKHERRFRIHRIVRETLVIATTASQEMTTYTGEQLIKRLDIKFLSRMTELPEEDVRGVVMMTVVACHHTGLRSRVNERTIESVGIETIRVGAQELLSRRA